MKFGWILAAALLPVTCLAANARHPYSNIDHFVDAGNDTGDARMDALNAAQLQAPHMMIQARSGSRFVPGIARIYPRRGYPPPYPQAPYPPPAYGWPGYRSPY